MGSCSAWRAIQKRRPRVSSCTLCIAAFSSFFFIHFGILQGTNSGQKHEILYSKFGINYSAQPRRFRTGSVLVREQVNASSIPSSIRLSVNRPTSQLSNGEIDASVISLEDSSGTNSYETPTLVRSLLRSACRFSNI